MGRQCPARHFRGARALVLCLFTGLPLAAYAQAPTAPARPPINVTVTQATKGALPFRIEAIGSAQPFASVQLRTRVDAQIQRIAVPDGASVKAGDLLVKLDSRQVEAQLRQAQATLDRDKAVLEQNLRDVARYTELVAKKSTPQINLDNAKTSALSTRAAIAGDEAAIEGLNVQLSYYTLNAPIPGRVGTFSLKAGNMARASDNTAAGTLTTINQVSPIYVAFSVPQRYLADLKAAVAKGAAPVQAKPQGQTRWIDGKVAVLDNAVDSSTGMLVVRATFENADEMLWPGQLCDLRVTLRVEDNVVSLPREAVQIGQKGNYVFLSEDNVARMRPVTIGRDQEGRTIITEGLVGTETVVVDGAQLLVNGAAINPNNAPKKGAS